MGREVDLTCCSSLSACEAEAILTDDFGAQFQEPQAPCPYPMNKKEVIRKDIELHSTTELTQAAGGYPPSLEESQTSFTTGNHGGAMTKQQR